MGTTLPPASDKPVRLRNQIYERRPPKLFWLWGRLNDSQRADLTGGVLGGARCLLVGYGDGRIR